jgi:FAD/FMN-containing dehydrogenase
VLADGTVVDRMSGLLKDNAGYDLPALLVGSEGTLGVITRVLWKLVARLEARVAALVGMESVEAAARALAVLRRELPSLEAVDFFLDDGLSLVLGHLRAPPPIEPRPPVYLLVECADRTDPTGELAAALGGGGGRGRLDRRRHQLAERLWRLREAHTEAIAAAGVPRKLDVGVPLDRLAEFLRRAPQAAGAGRPHGALRPPRRRQRPRQPARPPADDETADGAVLELAAACGGTISAEHGVGVAKARHLGLVRPPAERAAMRAIKRALDPDGLLNPGAVLSDA